jgi:hypothetical protein
MAENKQTITCFLVLKKGDSGTAYANRVSSVPPSLSSGEKAVEIQISIPKDCFDHPHPIFKIGVSSQIEPSSAILR